MYGMCGALETHTSIWFEDGLPDNYATGKVEQGIHFPSDSLPGESVILFLFACFVKK